MDIENIDDVVGEDGVCGTHRRTTIIKMISRTEHLWRKLFVDGYEIRIELWCESHNTLMRKLSNRTSGSFYLEIKCRDMISLKWDNIFFLSLLFAAIFVH